MSALQLAADARGEAIDLALAREGDEVHFPLLPRLEPHCRAGGYVEPVAACRGAVELERAVGLEEMIVRTHLNGPVAGVGDLQRQGCAALVEGDRAGRGDDLSRNHGVTGSARGRSRA